MHIYTLYHCDNHTMNGHHRYHTNERPVQGKGERALECTKKRAQDVSDTSRAKVSFFFFFASLFTLLTTILVIQGMTAITLGMTE